MQSPSTITTNSGKKLQIGFIAAEALLGIISELKEANSIQDANKKSEGTAK